MARTTCHPEVPPHTPPDGRKKVVYSKVLMMFGREGQRMGLRLRLVLALSSCPDGRKID